MSNKKHVQPRGSERPLVGEDDAPVAIVLRDGRAVMEPLSVRKMSMTDRVILGHVQDVVRQQMDLDDVVDDHVEELRARGHSWATIGWAVGITAEAARQHWGGKPE